MGDDNTPRSVLQLCRGREQMYRIKYYDGTYYDVNESHILALVCTSDSERSKYKTGDKFEVSIKDYIAWP